MFTINNPFVLLVVILSAGSLVTCEKFPLIQWPAGCDQYQVTAGARPRLKSVHEQERTNQTRCHALCTERTECGGYTTWSQFGNDRCYLYNVNDNIVSDHLGQNWYEQSQIVTWYSKTCPYDTGSSDLECDSYSGPQYDNLYIWSSADDRWRITWTWSSVPSLTAHECQAACTLHTGCRSVAYQRDATQGLCHLYNTTINHLLETGFDDFVSQNGGDLWNFTTYDRYCQDGAAYVPGSQVACGHTGADVTVTLPAEMRHDDVILYVAGKHDVTEHCSFAFTSQDVSETAGRVTVHVDYKMCGAQMDDKYLVLNTSIVAALQHSHDTQMFSIYHVYCQVNVVDDVLNSDHYNMQGAENPKDVISELAIDDVTHNDEVRFDMDVLNSDDVIQAGVDMTIRITSTPLVPFTVYDCSMVASGNDLIRVTILDHDGCESNGASINASSEHTDIAFPVKQLPYINQVYFSCHVSSCIISCPQRACDNRSSSKGVGVISTAICRDITDVANVNILTPHFYYHYKL